MNGVIETKFGTIDTTEYPIIRFKGNSMLPTTQEIEHFLTQLSRVMKHHKGEFVMFADARDMKAIGRDPREMLAVGLRHLEDEYADKYKEFVFYIPKIHLIILQKMVTLIVKPAVKQKVFFIERNATKYLDQLKKEVPKQMG